MGKNIFFYSNNCNYSKESVKKIKEYKLTESLIPICVDDVNIKIPPFINVVPTIYLSETKKIIIDDKLDEWLESNNQNKVRSEIESFVSSSLSDNFSYLDDKEDSNISNSFTFLDQEYSINTPSNDNVKKRTLEDLEKERHIDFKLAKNI